MLASIQQFSTTPASNTDIDGINVNTGWPPSNVGVAFRTLMSFLADAIIPQYIAMSSTSITLTAAQAAAIALVFTGTPGGTTTVTLPTYAWSGIIVNGATDGSEIVITTGSGGTVTVGASFSAYCFAGSSGVSGVNQSLSELAVSGLTLFGTSGSFYIDPDSSGNQLLNFASSEYIEFVPGTGFTWNCSGLISIVGSPVNVNGVQVVTNNGTWAIGITGNAATASLATHASTADEASTNFAVPGWLNVTGTTAAVGSGETWNGVTGIQPGPWSVAASIVTTGYIAAAQGFAVQSDRRKKFDIEPITPEVGSAWVMAGLPVTYLMDGEHRHAGFLAQDDMRTMRAEAVGFMPDPDPRVAKSDGFAPAAHRLTRDYNHDIAYLTAALQNALMRIETLEAKVTTL